MEQTNVSRSSNSPHDLDSLPDSAWLREWHLVPKKGRSTPVIFPFSSATLWRHIAAKNFPAPHKLTPRVSAWRVRDIREWIAQQA